MKLILLSAFFTFTLIVTGQYRHSSSSIFKNGKMYIYDVSDMKYDEPYLYVYTLKDGPISDIKPNIVNITNANYTYNPQFLNLPPGLPSGRSDQLWMMGALSEIDVQDVDIDEEHWSAQIINDNELKLGSGFIRKPDFENFPESQFTVTMVNNNNNPVLYIIGGMSYSKKLKDRYVSNYQFKYEFKTDTWSDLSDHTKSILRPVAYHRVIQAENWLILVGGATPKVNQDGGFNDTVSLSDTVKSNITDLYKFDLITEKWSSMNVKLNLEPGAYQQGRAEGLSLDVYNGKVITYANLVNVENENYDPKLGTLDYKANKWEWTWIDIKNDGGTDNNLNLMYQHTLVINDQLLLFHGVSNQKASKQIYSIDLKTNNLIGSVNISGKNGKSTNSGLPTWAIILISVICVIAFILILVALWFYYRYKNQVKPNEKNNQKMQEIWAASDVEVSRNKNGNAALTFGNNLSSTGDPNTSESEEAMLNYNYFQHEVDTHDMEDTKTSVKV